MLIYVLIFILFLLAVLGERIILFFRNEKRVWKLYKKSRHQIIYAEKFKGIWKRIEINAKIDYGTFVPCFKDEDEWKDYPDWAQNRDLIIERVTKKFPPKKVKSGGTNP